MSMKFSYATLLDYPLADSMEMIEAADQLGYHACYAADETWHKDMWLLFAAAADRTKNVRFGPSLSGIVLREPTLIAQALATLDELTVGRAEGVFSIGNFGLLSQYGMDWARMKPLSRVKEAHHVMRTFLDDGAITFDGDFYKYAGLFTDERERGRGVGRALILAVYEQARTRGVKRVYWQTQESNTAGRLLYDKVATHSGFIVYSQEV